MGSEWVDVVYFTEIDLKRYMIRGETLPNLQVRLGNFEFTRLGYLAFFIPRLTREMYKKYI